MENTAGNINLKNYFQACIEKHKLDKNLPVVVGVSGGLDSMTLLHLAIDSGLMVVVAHVNYGLRANESLRDRDFVFDFCKKHQIIFEELDASQDMAISDKRSTQMKARDIRRNFFEHILNKHKASSILLAHHADDQLETFFIQFFRNQGLFSLAGMDEKSGIWFRPLLGVRRSDIVEFANINKISWVEDSSNIKENYLRNKIRHRIIPEIEKLGHKSRHKSIESVARLNADRSALFQWFSELEKKQKQPTKYGFRIEKKELLKFQNPQSYLDFLFRELDVSYALIKEITANLTSAETKQYFSSHVKCIADRLYLSVYLIDTGVSTLETEENPVIITTNIPENELINLSFNNLEAVLDAASISGDLYLRKWQNADRFWPSGMEGSKLLSDYFTDLKYTHEQKQEQWLLCHGDDIVWLVNQRVDRRFMYKPGCKEAIKVSIAFG